MAKARFPENDRQRSDRKVLADPDIRGTMQGRRGRQDDPRSPNGNTPERVERAWNRDKKK